MVPSIKDVVISHQVNNKIESNTLPTIEEKNGRKFPFHCVNWQTKLSKDTT